MILIILLLASTRRKALKPHTFKNGPHVPAGNIVCIPSYNIMNDASLYPSPQTFDGFRFMKASSNDEINHLDENNEGKGMSKVTDVNLTYPF
jgi:cytochrome P450